MAYALIASLAVTAGLSALIVCYAMIRIGIADVPDHRRKAHKAPVPTAGGVGIVFGASLALGAAAWLAQSSGAVEAAPLAASALAKAWLGGLFALGLGLLDDLLDLRAGLKFGVLTVLCLGFAINVSHVEQVLLWPGFNLQLGPVLGVLGTACWLMVMANAVNFMDGSNGLATGSTAIGLLALAGYSFWGGAPGPAMAALLLAAAIGGFLFWNFPGGRIFAGDAGSLFLGFVTGALVLLAIDQARLPVLLGPLLFMPILADVLLTLIWRARKGRNLVHPHRDHLYQVALRAGASHSRVAISYWMAMIHCALAATICLVFRDAGVTIAFVVTLGLFLYLSFWGRRFAEAHGLDAP